MPDPDHLRLFLIEMFILFFAGWGFVYLRPRSPRIGGLSANNDHLIIGAFPRSPRPITVDKPLTAARMDFIYGLNQVQSNSV